MIMPTAVSRSAETIVRMSSRRQRKWSMVPQILRHCCFSIASAPGREIGKGPEGDQVLGEKLSCPNIVHRPYAIGEALKPAATSSSRPPMTASLGGEGAQSAMAEMAVKRRARAASTQLQRDPDPRRDGDVRGATNESTDLRPGDHVTIGGDGFVIQDEPEQRLAASHQCADRLTQQSRFLLGPVPALE
jgi:hypothetical protein